MSKDYESSRCDVVIVTALPVERQAVLEQCDGIQEVVHPLGTIYQRAKFVGEKQTFTVAIVEIGMGGTNAAVETERALSFFHPRLALLVGIAGGLNRVRIGDVVAGAKVYNYESGKTAEAFLTRPEVWRASYALEQRAREEARKQQWLRRLGEWAPVYPPRAFIGAIAAGEKVFASRNSWLYHLLRQSYEDALIVEMESHGFLAAVHADETISALVVRGVSDLLNDKARSDALSMQRMAARHAAAFAFEVLFKFESLSHVS